MSPSIWAAKAAVTKAAAVAVTKAARAAAAAVILLALAGFVAWAIAQREPRLYRVGLVAPFEGLYRETGYAALDATRQQVDLLNQRLAGRGVQFQVWAVDDGNDPALALARANELAADPLVLAVVGHFTPETTAAGAQAYAEAGLAVVAPVAVAGDAALGGTILSLSPAPAGLPAIDRPLLSLERALVTGAATPSEVTLPYTYCPDALVALKPGVRFALATAPGFDGAVSTVSTAAAAQATQLIEQAVAAGSVTRAAVAEAASAYVAGAGWVHAGPAWYDPTLPITLVECSTP